MEYHYNEVPTSSILELNCKLLSGANDSVIIDRTLSVNINNEPLPPDQVQLTRLPAYPEFFVPGIDSSASWLFQPKPVS